MCVSDAVGAPQPTPGKLQALQTRLNSGKIRNPSVQDILLCCCRAWHVIPCHMSVCGLCVCMCVCAKGALPMAGTPTITHTHTQNFAFAQHYPSTWARRSHAMRAMHKAVARACAGSPHAHQATAKCLHHLSYCVAVRSQAEIKKGLARHACWVQSQYSLWVRPPHLTVGGICGQRIVIGLH